MTRDPHAREVLVTRRRALLVLTAAIALSAQIALRAPAETPTPSRPSGSVLIEGVPHVRQKPDFCGEACAAMFLAKLGKKVDQDAVFDASGVDPAEGRGCHAKDLRLALLRLGFRPGEVWNEVEAESAAAERVFSELRHDLARGIPSVVCMRYDATPGASEHFRLVLGFDAGKDEVIYHEPAEPDGAYRRMPCGRFLDLWAFPYPAGRFTLIRLRLEPGRLVDAAGAGAGPTDADYAQRVMAVRKRLPSGGFTIVVEKPYVVIGDESPEVVRSRAVGSVRWAAERLRRGFFHRDPRGIIEVWLFKGRRSYESNVRSIFGTSPSSSYGYFSPRDRALVMNIATGGGTLVHEMVHAYVEANFPGCPAWFNEGLGSLFEQCRGRDGEIVGLTNWRLAGLKEAIRAKTLPTFERLCGMSSAEFYGARRGDNYAQARYLLYHLQQIGKLRAYYRDYLAARKADPSGYATLRTTLGEEDMAAFQARWEAWVMTLTFP